MSEMTPPDHFGELKRTSGTYVAVALLCVTAAGAGIDAAAVQFAQSGLQAGAAEYIEFGQLYLATLLLSGTVTVAIAASTIPTLHGPAPTYWLPIVILVGGATLTGLPVMPKGGTPPGWALGALATFADYYGPAFFTGLVVGAAGGGIAYEVAKYLDAR